MGFPQLIEEDFQCLDHALKGLLAKSEADSALLVEKAGHLIQQAGTQETFPMDVLATLAANSFNAVQFMAGLLNEDRFPGLYQQGEHHSTLMLNVDENCMLVIIFKAEISVGAVRFYAKDTAKTIADQLALAQQREPTVSFDLTDLNVSDVQGLFRRKEATASSLGDSTTMATVVTPEPPPEAAPVEPPAEPSAEAPTEAPPAADLPPAEPPAPMEAPPAPVEVQPPYIAKRGPYVVSVEAGEYKWCSCGRSQTQPFCDGAHKGTGLHSVRITIPQARRVAFCGCKGTQNPPFCDGTHSKL